MPKPKLPDDQRRIVFLGRVMPRTKRILEAVPAPNGGRALDRVVEALAEIRAAVCAPGVKQIRG